MQRTTGTPRTAARRLEEPEAVGRNAARALRRLGARKVATSVPVVFDPESPAG